MRSLPKSGSSLPDRCQSIALTPGITPPTPNSRPLHRSPLPPPAITDEASPFALRSTRKSSEDSSAPRRRFMSSGAAQLPSHRGSRCRHRGAVMGCRAPQTLQPEEVGRPSGGRRRRGRPGCRDADHAVRRSVCVRCPPCGRTSVQLVGWTSGVHASGVHASGMIRVSGRTPVRCPRPLQPRCPHRAGLGIHRCGEDRPRWAQQVGRVAGR
jgi:hypothetical protein